MELDHLRSFCAATRFKSISKAADYLNISQPRVSTHIRKLEVEFGSALLDRTRRPVEPTPLGEELARLATNYVDGIDSLKARVRQAETSRTVKIAAGPSQIPHWVLLVVDAFKSKYPETRLEIRSASTDRGWRLVASGEVDLALAPIHERLSDLDYRRLFTYERVLLTPLRHPLLGIDQVQVEQIVEWPLILTERGVRTRELVESEFLRAGVSYDIVMEFPDMDTVKPFVAKGMGVSIGPSSSIDPDDRKQLGIVSLSHIFPTDIVGIITRRGKTLPTAAQRLIEVAVDTVGTDS